MQITIEATLVGCKESLEELLEDTSSSITKVEIEIALIVKRMKHRKATGLDSVCTEV